MNALPTLWAICREKRECFFLTLPCDKSAKISMKSNLDFDTFRSATTVVLQLASTPKFNWKIWFKNILICTSSTENRLTRVIRKSLIFKNGNRRYNW